MIIILAAEVEVKDYFSLDDHAANISDAISRIYDHKPLIVQVQELGSPNVTGCWIVDNNDAED